MKKFNYFDFLNSKKFQKMNEIQQKKYLAEKIHHLFNDKLHQLVQTYDLFPEEIPKNLIEQINNKNIQPYFIDDEILIKPIFKKYNLTEDLLDINIGYDYLGFYNLKKLIQ